MGKEISSDTPDANMAYLQGLVERVRGGEIGQMAAADVDALDDAIEKGLVDEASLRGVQDAA